MLPIAVSLPLEDISQLAPTVVLGLLYTRRAHTLAGGGHPVPGWRQVSLRSAN